MSPSSQSGHCGGEAVRTGWDYGGVTAGLPAPTVSGLVAHWSVQPVAVIALVGLVGWYSYAVRAYRTAGNAWPASRVVTFWIGIVLAVWTTCGFPQAYAHSLFWIWTAQQLGLLLIMPAVILGGGPLELARRRGGDDGWVQRFVDSGPVRALANPLIGPALIPLASVVLFFGPVPGWAIGNTVFGWVLPLLVFAVGGLVVLRLIGLQSTPSSLAVGLALAIGSFELVIDAVPGIALRLHRTTSTTYFHHRLFHTWAQGPVHDQQLAGSILWCVAELVDLPFLVLVFRQWLRADARDAAEVDAVLEAERIVVASPERPAGSEPEPARDLPWWVSDPSMQNRLKRQG
jgi:cytochrome c oxidase assembly factor CtaG